MKHLFPLLLFFLPALLCAQAVDSTAIRQVDSLIQVSRTLTGQQQYEQALAVNAEAEQLALGHFGRESAVYGRCCFNRGRVFYFKGDKTNAEKWYLESKGIYEKTVGKEHPEYAWSLNNLALLYATMGQYERAEPLNLEALVIREKALGKEHPDYASSLNNLATLYMDMGQYEKAEPLLLEAKDIREKALGKEHPHYAHSLNNLANLYYTLGQYEKAEPLHLEAKDIRGKALGKAHPEYAQSLNNLAALYGKMHQYEKAERLHLEGIDILEKSLGKEHPEYARSLYNLALMYHTMGLYEKAEPLFLEALAIWGKTLGKEHPLYAHCLNNLANLYRVMGQNEKAERLFREALAIREKSLGKQHPEYVSSLNNLALLYHDMDQTKKAEPLFLELSSANKRLLEKAALHLSERELNIYLNTFSIRQNNSLSFTHTTGSKILIPTDYDNSLFYKGFLLQSAGRIRQLALSDTAATEKFNRLKGYQRRLATLYAMPIAKRDSALVAQLETQANDLEKDLTRTVAGYAQTKRQVTWLDVQAALKPGEAAVEFVHYRYYHKKSTDSTLYAALVLQPGNTDPVFISLFEERSLDSLLSTHGERKADYVNNLYAIPDRGATPLGLLQKSLYELLWRPLEKELSGVKTVYFSPSGLLHRLNLGAIPIPPPLDGGQGAAADETLSDRFRMIALTSTRQLVVPDMVHATGKDAALFGGIQYNMDSTAIPTAGHAYAIDQLASRGELSFTYTDSTYRSNTWRYLKWTEKEVDNITATLAASGIQTDTRKGYTATEESFKTIGRNGSSPRILHLATHGFFFPDPKISATPSPLESGPGGEAVKLSDHPMIRSGLILAGANHAWATGKPLREGMEDGILTAYEISQMNLSNTELVVLSACETGLGDIQGNEGVYGLQRAFKIAGAKYLVMSLWQVPDQETSVFMTTFYKHWLTDKQPIPDAFRTTQQEMRERFINPYQWAGFVLVE